MTTYFECGKPNLERKQTQAEESGRISNDNINRIIGELSELRLIYTAVLEELDVLKKVIADVDELKGQHSALKGQMKKVETDVSKSLIETTETKRESNQGTTTTVIKKKDGSEKERLRARGNSTNKTARNIAKTTLTRTRV